MVFGRNFSFGRRRLDEIHCGLSRQQFAQQFAATRDAQQSQCAQQDCGIGQQSQAPGQAQAVEEHLTQAQLVLLEGLRRFDPRPHLLEKSLCRVTAQGE